MAIMTTPVRRFGARVILLDPEQRVLLIHEATEPDRPYWLTPGGGIEPGETPQQAAAREVLEETGIEVVIPPDAPAVFTERRLWAYNGVSYDQSNVFFAARVPAGLTLEPAHLTAMEQATLLGLRWWTLDDLSRSDEVFYPAGIAELVERAAADLP
jgi:ADP-ribose pyrophosphatase YjhB (NUDIX family)